MKKWIIGGLSALLLVTGFRIILGFFPWQIGAAIEVATGLGAKLACSGKYVSGLNNQQIMDDLASYSPVTRLLELDYSMDNQVTATLIGMAKTSASFRQSLGCTLDIGDTAHLNTVSLVELADKPLPWPAGETVNTIDDSLQSLVEKIVAQDNANNKQTRALLVVHRGMIVAEAYASGFDERSSLLGWSMGKSIMAMLIGRMEYLDLADIDSERLFKQWENDERAQISLENLLQMTSGLDFDETYAPGSDSTHMLFSARSASDVALSSDLTKQPGKKFSYSSGTTNLIARWLVNELGSVQASYNFLHDELFIPAGINSMVLEPDPSGVMVGSSYIYATGRDWARLGLIMLNQGMINGQRLLSVDWIKRASKPNGSSNYQGYGYQFWLNSNGSNLMYDGLPEDSYFMQGNRKQYVMVSPSNETVIVRLGWTSGGYPLIENFGRILDAL